MFHISSPKDQKQTLNFRQEHWLQKQSLIPQLAEGRWTRRVIQVTFHRSKIKEEHYCCSANSGHDLHRFVYFPVRYPSRCSETGVYSQQICYCRQMKPRLGSRSCPPPGGLLKWGKAALWRCSLKCIRISITISMSHATEGAHPHFWSWNKGKIKDRTVWKCNVKDQKPAALQIQEVTAFNKLMRKANQA